MPLIIFRNFLGEAHSNFYYWMEIRKNPTDAIKIYVIKNHPFG